MDNSIYGKVTSNIEKHLTFYIQKKTVSSSQLNEKLILNLTLLHRFLSASQKLTQETNFSSYLMNTNDISLIENNKYRDTLDVFVPSSRLSKALRKQINEQNNFPGIGNEDNENNDVNNNQENISKEQNNKMNLLQNDFDKLNEAGSFIYGSYNNNLLYGNDYQRDITDKEEFLDEGMGMSFQDKQIEEGYENKNRKENVGTLLENETLFNDYSYQDHFFQSEIYSNQNQQRQQTTLTPVTRENTITTHSQQLTPLGNLHLSKDKYISYLNENIADKIIKEFGSLFLDNAVYTFEVIKKAGNAFLMNPNNSRMTIVRNNVHVADMEKFKSFLLEIGISDMLLYNDCIRNVIYNKSGFIFQDFINCAKQIMNVDYEHNYLKYKFLLYLTKRYNEKYFQIQELEMFFNLLSNCKEYCEKELVDEIKLRLVDRFKYLFPKEDRLNLNQIAITLETFFNL